MTPPAAGEVHLWLLDLDLHGAATDLDVLDDEERVRAARLVFEEHRRRYRTHRAWLRRVLAAYLGVPPAALAYLAVANGKPALAPPHDGAGLHFNLSHSGALALLGVAAEPLGIDLEARRVVARPLELAARHFAPAELAWVRAAPAAGLLTRLLTCWTRKEAFIKATGEGLARGLRGFDVRPADPGPVPVSEQRGAGAPWYVLDLNPRPDVAAALCLRRATPRLHWARPPPGLDAALRPTRR